MLEPLAAVARGVRRDAGRTQLDVATRAGVSHAAISRFERAENWPQDVDRIVAAYATECDVDEIEIWRRAISR